VHSARSISSPRTCTARGGLGGARREQEEDTTAGHASTASASHRLPHVSSPFLLCPPFLLLLSAGIWWLNQSAAPLLPSAIPVPSSRCRPPNCQVRRPPPANPGASGRARAGTMGMFAGGARIRPVEGCNPGGGRVCGAQAAGWLAREERGKEGRKEGRKARERGEQGACVLASQSLLPSHSRAASPS
jgi:hypothetical protein